MALLATIAEVLGVAFSSTAMCDRRYRYLGLTILAPDNQFFLIVLFG